MPGDLSALAGRATREDFLWASLLETIANARGLPLAGIGRLIGMTPSSIYRLALCKLPRQASERSDLEATAAFVGADLARLAATYRLGRALQVLQGAEQQVQLRQAARIRDELDD
jgi:hypothetical protein